MLGAETIPATESSICLVEADMGCQSHAHPGQSADGEGRPVAAVFAGNDRDGYRYIIGSKQVDLRALSKELNVVLNGRGRGSAAMIQGSAQTDETTIRSISMAFKTILFDLDGTLTDPKVGITTCCQYGPAGSGCGCLDLKRTGAADRPAADFLLFREVYGITEDQARMALEKIPERFTDIGTARMSCCPVYRRCWKR